LPWASDSEAHCRQRSAQVAPVDSELLAHCDQVHTSLVQPTGFLKLLVCKCAPWPLGQRIDLGAVPTRRGQRLNLVWIQLPLLAAGRPDGSIGHWITPVTSENPFKT